MVRRVSSAAVLGASLLLAAAIGRAQTHDDEAHTPETALSESERILHVLNRFTPGATPALVGEVKRTGLKEWFEKQLKGDVPESDTYLEQTKKLETIALPIDEIFEKYEERIPKDATEEVRRDLRHRATLPTRELLAWVLIRAVHSNNHVRETSCDFLRNHFCVSIDKGLVKRLVVDWEREVIRKRAFAPFGEILTASATHPAMLFFLDNYLSRRPPSPEELARLETQVRRKTGSEERAEEAVDIAKQRGLNENYARELMELHTLGVDNHYTQDDVISVAKCLTGWTIKRKGERCWEFEFQRGMHVSGEKRFLGGTIPEHMGDTTEGGLVLDILRRHQTTATFLSRKLCRFLVSDEPDPALVKRIGKTFRETDGDLRKVYRAILADKEFFARKNFRTKFKRPWEYVVSALRVTGADVTSYEGVEQSLTELNEPLYRCADPTGYYDQAEAWADPGAMATRWTFASDLALGRIKGVKVPAVFYEDLDADRPEEWADLLIGKVLPVAGLTKETRAHLDKLLERTLEKGKKNKPLQVGPVILAVLLGAPEFQKQ